MALIGPKYEQSAVDIISPMLNITQQMRSKNDTDRNTLLSGVKGLSEGIGGAIAMKKRADAIKYKGDTYIDQLKAEKAELEAELVQVQNEMRTIRAEDIGSLDETLVQQDQPLENDISNMPVNGRRNMYATRAKYPFEKDALARARAMGAASFNMKLDEEMRKDQENDPNRSKLPVYEKLEGGKYGNY